MKRISKILSLLLSVILTAQLLLLPAVGEQALDVSEPSGVISAGQSPGTKVTAEPYEVGEEIEAWREDGVKHYYLGDGVYEAVVKADTINADSFETQSSKAISERAGSNSVTQKASSAMYDTYISSSNKSTMYGEETTVWVGKAETGLFYQRMPTLAKNAVILSANFHFFYYYHVQTGNLIVQAYPMESPWDEYEDTWNTMATYTNLGIGTQPAGSTTLSAENVTQSSSNPAAASVSVTEIVQSWYSGERYNEGIALKRTGGTNNSVVIKAYESEEDTHIAYFTITYTLKDENEGYIPNGDYFIQNLDYLLYMQIDRAVSPSTAATPMEVWGFNGANSQKWRFTSLYNGYYKITSVESGYAITALSTLNTAIRQLPFTSAYNQQWKITVENGAYKLCPRSNETHFMASSANILDDNFNIKIKVEMMTDQADHKDEWLIIGNCEIQCIGIPDADHTHCDHTSTFPTVISEMERRGFNSSQVHEYISASTLLATMASSKITVTNSHGLQNLIELNDTNFTSSLVNNLPVGTLSNVKLVLYVACETGKGGTGANNLVNATADKGAQIVIGFKDEIYCDESDAWTNAFFTTLGNGGTVDEAIGNARQAVAEGGYIQVGTTSCYPAGNTNQTIYD